MTYLDRLDLGQPLVFFQPIWADLRAGLRVELKDDVFYRCEEAGCGGLLRPYVVWFGENLDSAILEEVDRELALCDLCLVVGFIFP